VFFVNVLSYKFNKSLIYYTNHKFGPTKNISSNLENWCPLNNGMVSKTINMLENEKWKKFLKQKKKGWKCAKIKLKNQNFQANKKEK